MIMKDNIMNILPENIHVVLGMDDEPEFFNQYVPRKYHTVEVPKEFLKHGEIGTYSEWTWKKSCLKRIESSIGKNYMSWHIDYVQEWNQLQNVGIMLKAAKKINFDILSYVDKLDLNDCKYLNQVAY